MGSSFRTPHGERASRRRHEVCQHVLKSLVDRGRKCSPLCTRARIVRTFSLMVSDADVCLRKMLAIPTLNSRSSGTCLLISDVMRWHPLQGAVTVMVRCAHPDVPVLIFSFFSASSAGETSPYATAGRQRSASLRSGARSRPGLYTWRGCTLPAKTNNCRHANKERRQLSGSHVALFTHSGQSGSFRSHISHILPDGRLLLRHAGIRLGS